MPTIAETLRRATERLAQSGLAEPRREAASLLGFALGRDRTFLIAHAERALTEDETARFDALLARRAAREPVQQITGRQEFYGLEFLVTPDVLIPRPETEMIVEAALEFFDGRGPGRFVEVGVGSGCISVAILHENARLSAVGLDVSEQALGVAAANAARHGVADRLELKTSDVFAALTDEKFDLVASNPPYIPRADVAALQPEVRDFEPLGALTDGADGLSIIAKIISGATQYLYPGGLLLMEIGVGQAAPVRALFDPEIWPVVEIRPDLQGIPRMVRAVFGGQWSVVGGRWSEESDR